MRPIRIKKSNKLLLDYDNKIIHRYLIQVKVLGIWWTVQHVDDTEEWYAKTRSEEIVSYMHNE